MKRLASIDVNNRRIETAYMSSEAYRGFCMRYPSLSRLESFSTGTDGYGLLPIENISHNSTPYDQLFKTCDNRMTVVLIPYIKRLHHFVCQVRSI